MPICRKMRLNAAGMPAAAVYLIAEAAAVSFCNIL